MALPLILSSLPVTIVSVSRSFSLFCSVSLCCFFLSLSSRFLPLSLNFSHGPMATESCKTTPVPPHYSRTRLVPVSASHLWPTEDGKDLVSDSRRIAPRREVHCISIKLVIGSCKGTASLSRRGTVHTLTDRLSPVGGARCCQSSKSG